MSNYLNYKNGIGHAPSFIPSGRPFIHTSSSAGESTVEFPTVTKAFTIHSASADLDIYFNPAASSTEKITITPAQCPQRFELKCRNVILSGTADYQMYAELTSIGDDYNLTGSGIG